MRKPIKGLCWLVTLVIVGGCQMSYQAASGNGAGYSEHETKFGCHLIGYKGGKGWYDQTLLVQYWHKRASELCPLGYEYSELSVVTHNTSINMSISGVSTNIGAPGYSMAGVAMCLDATNPLVNSDYPYNNQDMSGTEAGNEMLPTCFLHD
jgi:hypothetical protein